MRVHIGKEIERVLKEREISVTSFAKKINTSRENVYSIFKRPSIDTSQLYIISEVLNYNFYLLVTPPQFLEETKAIIADLSTQLGVKEQEVNYLKEINSLNNKVVQFYKQQIEASQSPSKNP